MASTAPSTPEHLQEAFATFNQLSEQLVGSYHDLQGRVEQLNAELSTAKDERIKELTEKERLASRLSALLSALPGGVIVLDSRGVIQDYNPAAASLLGEPLKQLAWSEVIGRAFSPRSDDGHEVSLTDGRRVSISTCPLESEPGQILLLTDVTEMRRLQDRLSQHQRLAAMGEMAASLAHQIRTPLSSALLYASNLKRPHLDDEQRERFATKIRSRLGHLEQVVNDMLLYARGGLSGVEKFTLAELLQDLEHFLEAQIQSSKTRFIIDNHLGTARLCGNRQMLLSAMINLCMNAIQAMGRGGSLCIDVRRTTASSLQLRIMDNGPGIDKALQGKIFNPFYTTRQEGTGLGLAVVAAVVRAHEGDIALHSQPGEGSNFILDLPILERVADVKASVGETASAPHPASHNKLMSA
ncbi:MAG: ATP-binding protein [Gammaproteobacteria bacterium]